MSEPEVADAEIVDDEQPTTAALTPVPVTSTSALVEPAATAEVTLAAFNAYNDLCRALLTESDFQAIAGKQFKKKSAWRKLSVAFGVSTQIVERNYTHADDGRIIRAEFVVQAVAPNGRHEDGVGLCDRYERCCEQGCTKGGRHRHCPGRNGEPCDVQHFSHPEHDIPATAHTRAKNRACADLYGFGEVSAEEMKDEPRHDDTPEGSTVGGAGTQGSEDGDAYCTNEQLARIRELTQAIPPDLKSSVVHNKGKQTLVFGVEVRTADGKVGLMQSQYQPLVDRLTNIVAENAHDDAPSSAKVDTADPEQAPFTGAGVQPEPTPKGKGYDGWTAKDLSAECELHGLPKSGEKSKLIGRLRAWDATNREQGYVEPDERPF